MTPARIDLNEERRQHLLAALRGLGWATVSDLCGCTGRRSNASKARLRRDLRRLEIRGLVVRENRDRLGWRWRAL